ncbi:unnamed protein product, partial [marine sediment metagenome]
MIFVLVFSALAVSIATLSGTNLQIADNQRKANRALGCAESGLDILRFWLGGISMPGMTQQNDRFSCLANFLHTDLAAYGISNILATYDYDADNSTITITDVVLDSSEVQSFSSQIQQTSNDRLQMDVTGSSGVVQRTIRVNYNFGTRAHTVFDYGVATRGALNLYGNIEMSGANVELDAGVYIESSNDANALSIIGNSSIAGDVYVTNPDASVYLQGGQA